MNSFIRFCLVAALLLSGCTSRGSAVLSLVPSVVDSRPAIIVIPGFYGSALKDKNNGKRVFLTGFEALFGQSALSLFQKELGTPTGPELQVEGLLGAVTVVPGLYEVEVYAPLIRLLRRLRPDAQILPLAYDWRDDLSLGVAKLDALVQLLKEKNCQSISVVAHSAGGLVLTYYLGYGNQPYESAKGNWAGAENIQRAIFMGVPFGGTMITFRSFEKGSGLPKSDRLLSADAMSSFPSMYQLLPSTANLLDLKGEKTSLDMFDPEIWKRHQFGLFRRSSVGPALLESRGRFVSEWLGKARKWNDLIQLGRTNAWVPPTKFKALNIVGVGRETLDSGYLETTSGKLFFDPEDVRAQKLQTAPLFNNGDGTVTLTSSTIPAALENTTTTVKTDFPHDKLFLDPALEKEYKSFL